ncbi:MAG: DNA-binding transcriptional regulator [Pirellulales bacterium]|nr:DNA-binding transcriptional regulator [Pirellulales bacterium]
MESSTEGIAEFARQQGGWTFAIWSESFSVSMRSLRGWDGDGAISLIDTESEARETRGLGIPVVNLSGALRKAGLPRVMVDQEAVGCLAAEHLLACGFRRFAFFGAEGPWYTELRKRGFSHRVRQEGFDCAVYTIEGGLAGRHPWEHGRDELDAWLRGLVCPVGVMASTDHRARMVVEACARLGLRVPSDVGVIGVDNEALLCEFCEPSLSSVSRSNFEVGFEAARLLSRLMSGRRAPAADVLIQPDGIVQRQSTDIVGVADPNVAAAVRYIRENLDRQYGIKQIASHLSVSRRRLEQGFRAQLGCTPYEYLSRLRVQRAKQLLGGPQRVKISQIARACGFNNALQLRRAFHRALGMTPQRYRQAAS